MWPVFNIPTEPDPNSLRNKAGIPLRRHGHGHRHRRRLPREDRREDVGVSSDFPFQLATNMHEDPRRLVRHA